MKISVLKPLVTALLAVSLVAGATAVRAAETAAPEAKPEAAKPAARKGAPYGGTLSAKTTDSITVKKKDAEKTFTVTSTTKITKAGKPATLEDAVVGEDVGVFFKTGDDGKAEALSIRFGAKPEKAAKSAEAATGEKKHKAKKTEK